MSLNIADLVYQNSSTNRFKPQFKQNTQIIDRYQKILRPLLKPNNQTKRQNYFPTLIVPIKSFFVIADTSNQVLKYSNSNFQSIYRHNLQINCLITN